MKILITGAAGFIGRSLVRALPASHEVVAVDCLTPEVHGAAAAFPAEWRQRAQCLRCDIADAGAWRAAAAGSDVVVHLAALTGTAQSGEQPQRYVASNVEATARLCETLAAVAPRPRRVILASSRAIYGEGAYRDGDRVIHPGPRRQEDLAAGRWDITNAGGDCLRPAAATEDTPAAPASIYAATKLAQEQLLSAFAPRHGTELLILRLQNVYGPLQAGLNPHAGIVAALTRAVTHDRHVELFEDGGMTRDFVHVDDVVRVLREAIDRDGPLPRTLNVGTGVRTSLRDVVARLSYLTGERPALSCAGRYRRGDVRHALADTTACRAFLGAWEPTDLDTGLASYVDWFAHHREDRACL